MPMRSVSQKRTRNLTDECAREGSKGSPFMTVAVRDGLVAQPSLTFLAVAEKRRLPIIKSTPDEPGEPPRPPWHWVGFGAVAIFGAWLPLAYAAEALKRRLFGAYLGPTTTPQEVTEALDRLSPAERTKLTVVAIGVPLVPLLAASFFGGF